MKTVKISADLERRLRASPEPLSIEIVKLLDEKKEKKPSSGLSYSAIVQGFRQFLGTALVVPANPSYSWIGRQVLRAKDIGLDDGQIQDIAEGVRAAYPRGPWELEFLLRNGPRLAHSARSRDVAGETEVEGPARVVTGRPNFDDD